MWIRQVAFGAAGALLVWGVVASQQVHAVTSATPNPIPTRNTDLTHGFATRVFPSHDTPQSFVVPAGKYLVITSVNGFTFGGTSSDVEMDAVVATNISATRFPFSPLNGSGMAYLQNTDTQVVADPGSTVYFYLGGSGNDSGGYNVDVKGYFIPAS